MPIGSPDRINRAVLGGKHVIRRDEAHYLAAGTVRCDERDRLGFQLSMFLFLMYHLKLRSRRSWVSSLIIALAGSVGAFYAFNYGLNVALPVSAFPLLNTIGL